MHIRRLNAGAALMNRHTRYGEHIPMNSSQKPQVQENTIVNLVVDEKRGKILKDIAVNLPDIALNNRQICDLELIASGVFSPLTGFMVRADYESVLDRMRLQNDVLWPLPVCLDVIETQAQSLEAGQSVALRDPEGFLLAVLHVEDIWPVDRPREAQMIYDTMDQAHPSVDYLFNKTGDYYIGGQLEVISLPLHFDYQQLRLTPMELQAVYHKLGWQRILGFKTTQPIHRAQFEMMLHAMRQTKANLLLLPVAGMTKPDDFDHYTRVRCYRNVAHHFPPNTFFLNLLPLAMRLAGPRDALLDLIIARNYGCTHMIVGPDHASPSNSDSETIFYKKTAARDVAQTHCDEIGVKVVAVEEMVYLPYEDEFRFADQVPESVQTLSLSGSQLRNRFYQGRKIPEWATFPEVTAQLEKAHPPPSRQGFTVFLTGLSGAGKSTIAKILYSRFLEAGDRPVSLLDGDIVRRNLSSELSFSKEHRDINVSRIGFVASEITKNRGIAICAPIAPYAATRTQIRSTIEQYGGFIEVFVATPLEVCEKRDRKGMYAKARAGLIKGFTGVDDPYEIPETAEVKIDTTSLRPDEAAQEIMLYLGQRGFI